ncbi:Mak10 subunit, NatC N(alpha)-terminal acetyltransferase [Rhizoctonia solani]|uniref:Mak10 subunit, NatC N(Alpha)-terminal acetyltransferase n=1 Tax=Rhizoctonia solani TaxID=456999 RepID=A0A8H7III7_9AGAM|nr:Mak10 subunit, NatC N(alpha)-terminal acetyltransferase [Rhizoctonia solani]
MPNFSLFDAMSAIEIMDPRMDSALVPPGVDPPEVPFTDPNAPLLAEEVCWILDRTMAAEVSHPSLLPTYELYCSRKLTPILKMGWHSGYALSQTLYTSLYIHQIAPVSSHGALPQYFPAWRQDPARPMGLVSIVLQAGLMAIVKTCDWVWRELSGGNVFDLEDFNADKADVSLYEGVQVQTVVAELDKALVWLDRWSTTDVVWKYALHHRIALRKHILLSVSVGQNESSIAERATHVSNALASYHSVRAGPVPGTPPPSSPLHAAFDPTINRRLVVSMPLKVIKLMPTDDAWKALQGMLQGVLETCKALNSVDLLEMMMLLRLRARLPASRNRSAYVRSLNANQASKPERPVLQLFLSQLLGLSLDDIRALNNLPSGIASLPVSPEDLEESAERLLLQHALCLCHNRPRMRRKLSKSLADWHELWENTIDTALLVRKDPVLQRLRRLPLGILHIKLENIIDLTFAGFETELYGEAEWPLLYWHLSRVLTQQVQTLETLLRLIEADGALSHGTLLALFVRPPKALDVLTLSKPPTANDTLLIERRFKWAFGSHSRPTRYLDESRPNLESWMQFALKIQACRSEETVQEALKEFKEARVYLLSLLDKSTWKVTGGLCNQLMQSFLAGCIKVCNTQVSILDKCSDHDADSGKDDPSNWSFEQSSWFPAIIL